MTLDWCTIWPLIDIPYDPWLTYYMTLDWSTIWPLIIIFNQCLCGCFRNARLSCSTVSWTRWGRSPSTSAWDTSAGASRRSCRYLSDIIAHGFIARVMHFIWDLSILVAHWAISCSISDAGITISENIGSILHGGPIEPFLVAYYFILHGSLHCVITIMDCFT